MKIELNIEKAEKMAKIMGFKSASLDFSDVAQELAKKKSLKVSSD